MMRFPEPQKFNGTTPEVTTWTREMNRYLKTQSGSSEQKTLYAAMKLTGMALTWWNHLESTYQEPQTWRELRMAIESKFKVINRVKKAEDALIKLRQTGSVQQFISKFNELALLIPDLSITEQQQMFMRGLKFEILEELEMREISLETHSFDGIQEIAVKYDDLKYMQQMRSNRESTSQGNKSK